jgi:ABC-type multidrug transport system ATPase subunit
MSHSLSLLERVDTNSVNSDSDNDGHHDIDSSHDHPVTVVTSSPRPGPGPASGPDHSGPGAGATTSTRIIGPGPSRLTQGSDSDSKTASTTTTAAAAAATAVGPGPSLQDLVNRSVSLTSTSSRGPGPGDSVRKDYTPNKGAALFVQQFLALSRKNLILFLRRPGSFIAVLLAIPLSLCLALIISGLIMEFDSSSSSSSADASTPFSFGACAREDVFGRTTSAHQPSCITMLYGPHTAFTSTVMKNFATLSGLTYGVDIIPSSEDLDQVYHTSESDGIDETYETISSHIGLFDVLTIFTSLNESASISSHDIEYTLFFNQTRGSVSALRRESAQAYIDRAILHALKTPSASIPINPATASLTRLSVRPQLFVTPFPSQVTSGSIAIPYTPGRHNGVAVIGGKLLAIIAGTLGGIMIMFLIASEKQNRILGSMRLNGMTNTAYWLSWLCALSCFAVITALVYVGIGNTTRWVLFQRTNFSVFFFAVFLYCVCIASQAMFFASLFTRPAFVNAIAYINFIIITLLSTLIFDENAFYKSDTSVVAKLFFFWFPHFHFGKIFTDLVNFSDVVNAYGVSGGSIGSSFSWADITVQVGTSYSVSYALWMLVVFSILYSFLAWYVSQVVSDGMGSTRPPQFLLMGSYWREVADSWCNNGAGLPGDNGNDDVLLAGDRIGQEQLKSHAEGSIRMLKVTKSYGSVTAVKELTMDIQPGQVFCMLGHNGAGKSTLINVMSGLVSPTFGSVFVAGNDVNVDQSRLRDIIGHCSQSNVLWDELTAEEHMNVFAALRGIPDEYTRKAGNDALAQFNLETFHDMLSTSMSGGMKRRLCMSIATLGQPSILFFDEPTTGMDPVNKHKVWQAIRQLKRGRIIVLTTHLMDEADWLGDTVAMMQGGHLKAIGTPLYLKNRYGEGYSVQMLAKQMRHALIRDQISRLIPQSKVVANSNNLTVAIPTASAAALPDLFRWLQDAVKKTSNQRESMPIDATNSDATTAGEHMSITVERVRSSSIIDPDDDDDADPNAGRLVQEWSFSSSTLEEVFLRICVSGDQADRMTAADAKDELASGVSASTCCLCHENLAETVDLYTEDHVAVSVADVVCRPCAMGSKYQGWAQANFIALADDHTSTEQSDEKDSYMPVNLGTLELAPLGIPADNSVSDADNTSEYSQNPLIDGDGDGDGDNDDNDNNDKAHHTDAGNANNANQSFKVQQLQELNRDAPPSAVISWLIRFRAIAWKNIWLIWVSRKSFYFKVLVMVVAMLTTVFQKNQTPTIGCSSQDNMFCGGSMTARVNRFKALQLQGTTLTNADGNSTWMMHPSDIPKNPYYPSAVWFQEAGGSSVPFSSYIATGLTPIGQNNSMLQYRSFSPSDAGSMSMYDRVRLSQTEMIDSPQTKLMSSEPNCYSAYKRGRFFKSGELDMAYAWTHMFPYIGVDVTESSPADLKLDFHFRQFACDADTVFFYEEASSPNGYCRGPNYRSYCQGSDSYQEASTLARFVNGMSISLGRTALSSPKLTIRTTFAKLPEVKYRSYVPVGPMSATLSFSVLLSLLLFPNVVSRTVQERDSGIARLFHLQGVSAIMYWSTNFVFDCLLFVLWNMLFMSVAYVSQSIVFAALNPGLYIVCAIVGGIAMNGTAVAFASLFNKPSAATGASVMLVIVLANVAPILFNALTTEYWPGWMYLFPPLAYIRAVSELLRYGGGTIPTDSDASNAMVGMFVYGLLWFAIGIYLNALRDGYPFYWCIPPKLRFWQQSEEELHANALAAAAKRQRSKNVLGIAQSTGKDVEDEAKRVEADNPVGRDGRSMAIRFVQMRKVFPASTSGESPTVAVKGLSLGIDQGETIGFLGSNGAGKTTSLNVITGSLRPSAGQAYVNDHDIVRDEREALRNLGMCPQHDILFDELTVKQHLLLFARMNHVSVREENALVQKIAADVDLDGDAFEMFASQLSGGMARRLSLAISLVKNPMVWLLDEPSTGLDPAARREIWDIIEQQKRDGRTIVLTTHLMEEADTLCERLAIMVDGRLQCVGRKAVLKQRYGDGFYLSLVLNTPADKKPDLVAQITAFVSRVCAPKQVQLQSVTGITIKYVLPFEDGIESIIRVSRAMNVQKQQLRNTFGIMEWGLSPNTLEEVFIRAVEEARSGDGNDGSGNQ